MGKGCRVKIGLVVNITMFAIIILLSGMYNAQYVRAMDLSVTPNIPITAGSALLIEATSGKILFQKEPDKPLPPASITKIMTMLLAMEHIEQGKIALSDMVIASERAMSMGGSQIWLEIGEEMSLEDMMKSIAIVSANDSSVAVAEHIAGSEELFVDMMNKRSHELGMTGTHFVNASGLPKENHYTTARDIALMSRELLKYPKVHEWFTTWIDYVRDGKNILVNTNRLINSYDGVDGLKTGFTDEAGYCLSATAKRGNLRLIAVVLKVADSTTRFKEVSALFDLGFRHFIGVELVEKDQVIGSMEVTRGIKSHIDVVSSGPLVAVMPRGEENKVSSRIALLDKVGAPVEKGQKLGEIFAVTEDNAIIGQVDLVAKEGMERGNIFPVIFRIIYTLIRNVFAGNK